MAKEVKFHSEGIGLVPTSADPSNPAQGQLQYSGGTHRAEGLWRYNGTDWVRLAGGGGIISDWVDFTPTGTLTTAVSYEGKYRRVGSQLEVTGSMLFSGATDSGAVEINLPPGLSIDEVALDNQSGETFDKIIGNAQIRDNGAQAYACTVSAISSSSVRIISMLEENETTNFIKLGSADFGVSRPIAAGNADSIFFSYKVPIVGWETGVLPNEISEGKLHAFSTTDAGGQTFVHNVAAKVTSWDTPYLDQSAAWDAVNNRYVVQESGLYNIKSTMRVSDTIDADVRRVLVWIYVNGVQSYGSEEVVDSSPGNFTTLYAKLDRLIELNQGDYIEIYAYQINGDLDNLTTIAADSSHLTIYKLNNLSSQITPAETVSAEYTTDSGQSIPHSTQTTVLFEDKEHDDTNSYNTSTGVYTIPVSGKYLINSHTRLDYSGAAIVVIGSVLINRLAGGSEERDGSIRYAAGANSEGGSVSCIVNLLVGDEVSIRLLQLNADTSALTMTPVKRTNHFSIVKVGN